MIRECKLLYWDETGTEQELRVAGYAGGSRNSVSLSIRTEPISGGCIVHADVENKGDVPVRLRWLAIELDTGFNSVSPARFFKHGYQSWSASYPVVAGREGHPQTRSLLTRISHQSEPERPNQFPEAATSELFTIIESASSQPRFLCGFIGSTNHFTTVTISGPGSVTARALFDGSWLRAGETITAEPLAYWHSDEDAAQMASRWAELLGRRMGARTNAPYQRGWCSWYHYFDAITQDALHANVRRLQELRGEFPIDVVQLDDGYQAALGDWLRTNEKFPMGLKEIADTIRDAGFSAGLWTAPFLATRDSQLMNAHPDWFIRNQHNAALAVVNNPSWTRDVDKFAYALDPTHPECAQHLEQVFDRLVHEFGFKYLKLDFLFAAAAEGLRYDPNLTRAQALRGGLALIRRGAGEETFILGCGCPLGPAVGIVDGMRVGPDVAPYRGGDVEPGTRLAINAIVARSFMHRRLWVNDPDCMLLRTVETRLSREERFALASTIAVSGGMLLISDAMNLLDADCSKLFAMLSDIGLQVDSASADEPVLGRGLLDDRAVRILEAPAPHGRFYLLLNMGDTVQAVPVAGICSTVRQLKLIGPDGETDAPERIELPPHSARIIRL